MNVTASKVYVSQKAADEHEHEHEHELVDKVSKRLNVCIVYMEIQRRVKFRAHALAVANCDCKLLSSSESLCA